MIGNKNGYYICKRDFTNGLGYCAYIKKGDRVYLEFPQTIKKKWTSSEGHVLSLTEFFVKEQNGQSPIYKTGYKLYHFEGHFKRVNKYKRLRELLLDGTT